MGATILFLILVSNAVAYNMNRLIGTKTLQIGFDESCYLNWYEPSFFTLDSDFKPSEFRCGTKSGSDIEIEGSNKRYRYRLKSGDKYMQYEKKDGDVKPMQFSSSGTPDIFSITTRDGLFAIGIEAEGGTCYLQWKRGDDDDTEFAAEFVCNSMIRDTFWIKGEDCVVQNIKLESYGNKARFDGEEIIGHATSGTCAVTSYQTLILGHTDEVTEEISIELSKSKEVNWEKTSSLSVSASSKVMGIGFEKELSASSSTGESKVFGSSETKSTGLSNSKSSSSETHYNTPGAAMVMGYVKRYVFDNSNVPAKVTAKCKNGYQDTFVAKVKVTSKVFGSTSYSTDAVQFKPGKCTEQKLECMRSVNFNSFLSITGAKKAFRRCFPSDSIITQKKKIGKGRNEKSSSKSENKVSSQSTDKTI